MPNRADRSSAARQLRLLITAAGLIILGYLVIAYGIHHVGAGK